MTNEQILIKAIEQAIKNGMPSSGEYKTMIKEGIIGMLVSLKAYYNTIFSHSFAKAFWGEEEHKFTDVDNDGIHGYFTNLREWEFHLQQMVLEKEPILYLEKFLEEK